MADRGGMAEAHLPPQYKEQHPSAATRWCNRSAHTFSLEEAGTEGCLHLLETVQKRDALNHGWMRQNYLLFNFLLDTQLFKVWWHPCGAAGFYRTLFLQAEILQRQHKIKHSEVSVLPFHIIIYIRLNFFFSETADSLLLGVLLITLIIFQEEHYHSYSTKLLDQKKLF